MSDEEVCLMSDEEVPRTSGEVNENLGVEDLTEEVVTKLPTRPILSASPGAKKGGLRRMQRVAKELAKPFPPDAVKWRVQAVRAPDGKRPTRPPYPEGSKATFLAYIDARDVEERLDDVVGIGNWYDHYTWGRDADSVWCTLYLRLGSEWVGKMGCGYRNSPGSEYEREPDKAAESDALKRAAVKWGINRNMYGYPDSGWLPITRWGRPTPEAQRRLETIASAAVRGKVTAVFEEHEEDLAEEHEVEHATPKMTDAQRRKLHALFRERGLDYRDVEEALGQRLSLLDPREASTLIEDVQSGAYDGLSSAR